VAFFAVSVVVLIGEQKLEQEVDLQQVLVLEPKEEELKQQELPQTSLLEDITSPTPGTGDDYVHQEEADGDLFFHWPWTDAADTAIDFDVFDFPGLETSLRSLLRDTDDSTLWLLAPNSVF